MAVAERHYNLGNDLFFALLASTGTTAAHISTARIRLTEPRF